MDAFSRSILFWTICIPARTALAGLAFACRSRQTALRIGAAVALIPVIGFLYTALMRDSATDKGAFGGPTWWRRGRPFHSALYLLFVVLVFVSPKAAALPLFADVVLAALAGALIAPPP